MIPYAIEIEYLGFTGTQAINTLLLPNTLDFNILYTCYNNIKYGWVMQNYANGTWIASTADVVRYKNFNSRYNISDSHPNIFESWRYDMTSGFYRNGTLLKSFSASLGTTQISNVPLYIGQTYDMTAHKIESGTFSYDNRIKSVKIYRNGTLVRDYIPVRVGTTGYLYDKVSGQLFGNAGTGDFILGPDVAPVAYANEIAFLESTGSQYIDTGVVGSSDLSVVLKCHYPALSTSFYKGSILGSRVANNDNQYMILHTYMENFRYGNHSSNSWKNPTNRVLIFDNTESHNILKVFDTNNNLVTTLTATAETFNNNLNIVLFGINDNGNILKSSNRIYSLKMYEGTTLVRDFIPVEYNNIGYLYDKVSGKFFANQGTGKFVLGHRAPRFDGKACARSYTRRQLMAEKNKRFSLLYHWEASDGIVNNQWIDRRKGYAFTKNGSPIVTTVSDYEVMRTNYDNYFKANLNSPALNIGSEWMIAIEFIIAVFPTDTYTYLLDFGSLGPATHAFGLSVSTSKRLSMNVKLTGNTNTFRPPTIPVEFVEYKMSTIIFGAEPYDSTHNNIYTIAKGIKTSASSYPTIANCRFNGNFRSANGFFGRGWDNNGAYQSKSYKYIKSIKIYKDNKKR